MIGAIQEPPFEKVGVIELDTFFPKKDRAELAVAVNALLASPAAAGWARGEALDVARLLRTAEGETSVPVAHEDLYVRSVAAFCAAVRGEGPPAATGEDGVRSLATALAIAEACRSGRAVRIEAATAA